MERPQDYSFQCDCGSPVCRGIVTGFDWKKFTVDSELFNYFSAYLKEKIKLKGGQC
jgi:hypothetical protein